MLSVLQLMSHETKSHRDYKCYIFVFVCHSIFIKLKEESSKALKKSTFFFHFYYLIALFFWFFENVCFLSVVNDIKLQPNIFILFWAFLFYFGLNVLFFVFYFTCWSKSCQIKSLYSKLLSILFNIQIYYFWLWCFLFCFVYVLFQIKVFFNNSLTKN